ncbi:MAG: hypothetical protein ABFS34_13165 [Gemmatimonadota bacterium]
MNDILSPIGPAAVAVTFGALAACAGAVPTGPEGGAEPTADVRFDVEAEVGDTVRLGIGEAARFGEAGLVVRFDRLVADSRCPVEPGNGACVWEGDAEVALDLALGDGETELRLHTRLDPRVARLDGYEIALVGVLPVPTFEPSPDPAPPTVDVTVRRALE